jgi:hypothetical protein
MGKTYKDQNKKVKSDFSSMKQKNPGKRVRPDEFVDTYLEDDEIEHPNSSHNNRETC